MVWRKFGKQRRGIMSMFAVGASFLLATSIPHLEAETTIGGQIPRNETWSRAENPYVAAQNVEVPAGVTLKIEPGVEIRLAGQSFVVRGTLVARGTVDAPIRFTSANSSSPASMDWGLLTFEGTSGAAYDQNLNYVSGSVMEHVIVEYGRGLLFNKAAPLVSQCTIQHHRKELGGGIYVHGCQNAVIRDSVISNNVAEEKGGGIRAAYSPEPVLIGNRITHNSAQWDGGGISIDYNGARIEDNTISYNFASHAGGISTGETQVGQTSMTGKSHSKPRILRNTITNNTAYYSGGGIVVNGTPTIVGNTIAGNRIHFTKYEPQPSNNANLERKTGAGAGIKVTGTYGGPLSIQGNVIAGNRGAYWGAGMCFDRAAGSVKQNRIVGNIASVQGAAVSILVRSHGKSFVSPGHGSNWQFTANDLRGNSSGVFELAMARFGGTQSISVSGCNLAENEGKTFVNSTENHVTAAGNWWGTNDVQQIGASIDDYYDDRQHGQVRFKPASAANDIAGLPNKFSNAELAFMANCPEGIRAGQGFNRLPDTPPSVTIVWNAGQLENVAGYLVYFSRIEPRYGERRLKDGMRIPSRCIEGESPVDVGAVNHRVLSGFAIGESYEFFVTAYDSNGRESAMSDSFVVKVER